MFRPQNKGGLGLTNIWQYFLATKLTQMAQWFAPTPYIPWLNFESTSISPHFLQGLLWSDLNSHHKIRKLNNIVAHFLQLWPKIDKTLKPSSNTPPLASFLGDSRLLQNHNNNSFPHWRKNNLTNLRALHSYKTFPSFPTLQSKYNLPSSELMNYLQIKNFYTEHYSLTIQSQTTLFEHICINSSSDKGLISLLCKYLNNLMIPEKSNPMLHWEAELDSPIPLETWNTMTDNLRKCNMAASFRELPMKLFSRLYPTPLKIHSFYPAASPYCFRGCNEPGTYLHTFGAVDTWNWFGELLLVKELITKKETTFHHKYAYYMRQSQIYHLPALGLSTPYAVLSNG